MCFFRDCDCPFSSGYYHRPRIGDLSDSDYFVPLNYISGHCMLLRLPLHGLQLQILGRSEEHVLLHLGYYFRDFLCSHKLCYLYKHYADYCDFNSYCLQQCSWSSILTIIQPFRCLGLHYTYSSGEGFHIRVD